MKNLQSPPYVTARTPARQTKKVDPYLLCRADNREVPSNRFNQTTQHILEQLRFHCNHVNKFTFSSIRHTTYTHIHFKYTQNKYE